MDMISDYKGQLYYRKDAMTMNPIPELEKAAEEKPENLNE